MLYALRDSLEKDFDVVRAEFRAMCNQPPFDEAWYTRNEQLWAEIKTLADAIQRVNKEIDHA